MGDMPVALSNLLAVAGHSIQKACFGAHAAGHQCSSLLRCSIHQVTDGQPFTETAVSRSMAQTMFALLVEQRWFAPIVGHTWGTTSQKAPSQIMTTIALMVCACFHPARL